MQKEIKTISDFVGMAVGQVIVLHDEQAVYIGQRWKRTCSCCNVQNFHQFPHAIRVKDGRIELIEVITLEEPRYQGITGWSTIYPIGTDHEEYDSFKNLLIEAGIIKF
jgi:hypothetical protein